MKQIEASDEEVTRKGFITIEEEVLSNNSIDEEVLSKNSQTQPPQVEPLSQNQTSFPRTRKRKAAELADRRILDQTIQQDLDEEEEAWLKEDIDFKIDAEFAAELNTLEKEMLPSTWQEAMADEDWKQSMDQEIKSLTDNGTWTLEELPRGRKAMKTKWAYKIKRDSAGIQTKLKSRLNACGYSQVSGTDYDETYAPVGSKCLLRSLLAIAAYLDYEVQQIDFDSAFLNGKLDHELYMHQPGGYSDKTGRVCKLQKSIYGLKQAAIVWYDTLQELLSENGYEPSTRESCLFLLKPGRTGTAWIYVYVDDLLIIGPKGSCTQLAKNLSAKFKTKELGEAEFCLGIKITRNKKGILLTQKAFADAMVKDMMDVTIKAKRTYTAIPMNRVSEEADDDLLDDPSRYRSLVGAIGYLANTTRPDLSVAFSVLGSSMKSPTKKSWKLAQHCLGYI